MTYRSLADLPRDDAETFSFVSDRFLYDYAYVMRLGYHHPVEPYAKTPRSSALSARTLSARLSWRCAFAFSTHTCVYRPPSCLYYDDMLTAG